MMNNKMKSFCLHGFLCCFLLQMATVNAASQTEFSPPDTTEEVEASSYPDQDGPPEVSYPELRQHRPAPVPVAKREISNEKWRDARQHLDYSKDVPEPPNSQKNVPEYPSGSSGFDWTAATQWFGTAMQFIAIVLALGAIAFWITRLMQAPRNKRIASDGTEITAENIEAYIHETDLERFLREALASGNFTLAIRLYYLMIIKTLSEKGSIQWAKDKTNRDYLREMRDHRFGSDFREVTREYERVWYGNQALDAARFSSLEMHFKSFLNQL